MGGEVVRGELGGGNVRTRKDPFCRRRRSLLSSKYWCEVRRVTRSVGFYFVVLVLLPVQGQKSDTVRCF